MAMPSPGWLAALNAGLVPPPQADPFAAGAAAAGIAPPQAPNADATLMGAPTVGGPPIAIPGVQPAPAMPPAGPPPPPQGQQKPPITPAAVPPPPPQPEADPGMTRADAEFTPVTVGGSPGGEVPLRGPVQQGLMARSFMHPLDAADRIESRSQEMASREAAMYDAQANEAMEQQAAFQRQAERRAYELQQLQADYQDTISHLGEMQIDNNRLWNNSSTMDKVGATLLILLGSAFGGQDSLVHKALMKKVSDDVEAQKFAYQRGLDLAKGQQTAYGMAMQRFGSEDAAYHAALASGQQAVAAKIAGMNAHWKGTDAANVADEIRSKLLMTADQNTAQGLKFVQPTAGATKYIVSVDGKRRPGYASEKDAQESFDKFVTTPNQKINQTLVEGGVQSAVQDRKAAAEQAKAGKSFVVKLASGEEVNAPNEKEAGELRGLAHTDLKVRRLVARALQLRKEGFRTNPGNKGELVSIQNQLRTTYSTAEHLGALSLSDRDIVDGAIGGLSDLTNVTDSPERALMAYADSIRHSAADRVKTYPAGSSEAPRATGVKPATWKADK